MFRRGIVLLVVLLHLSARTASAQTTVTKVVPQIALGSFDGGVTEYETGFVVMNLHTAPITISASFFNPNGSASTVSYDRITDVTQGGSSFIGSMPAVTIPTKGMMLIDGDPTGVGRVNWASFTANGNFSVGTVIFVEDSRTGSPISVVGVPASAPDMKEFMFPRVFDPDTNADVGFAVVNTGGTSAIVTATLREMNGNVIVSKSITLAPRSHTSIFTRQFFGSSLIESDRTIFASLTMSSNSAQFAATALFIESGILTTLPVEKLQ